MQRKKIALFVVGALLFCILILGVKSTVAILFFMVFFGLIYKVGAIEVRTEEEKVARAEGARRKVRELEAAEREEEERHQMGYCKTCNPRVPPEYFVIMAEWNRKQAEMTLARYAH